MTDRRDFSRTSTDSQYVFQSLMPSPIARAWSQAFETQGDPIEKLNWCFGFLEYVMRFCACVVLAANPKPRGAQKGLLRKLATPGLGLWAAAARDGAKDIPADSLLAPVARLFWTVDGSPSALSPCLTRLIEKRNKWAHGGSASVSPASATNMLKFMSQDLTALLRALEGLKELELHLVALTRSDHTGQTMNLLRMRGLRPLRSADDVEAVPQLGRQSCFLLADHGHALLLAPYILANPRRPDRLLLLEKVGKDGQAHYTEALHQVEFCTSFVKPESHLLPLTPTLMATLKAPPLEQRPRLQGLELQRVIGCGGSGRVWLAQREDGAQRALKVLRAELAGNNTQSQRLKREFEVLYRLGDPGVVRVFEMHSSSRLGPILEMEYLPGRNLRERIQHAAMSPEERKQLFRQLTRTLALLHSEQVIHRDIKPENVMFRGDQAVLLDFGTARVSDQLRLTGSLVRLGTLNYAAPEQAEPGAKVDCRADIFAMGRLLGFCYSGSHEPAEHRERLPIAMLGVYERATAPDPDARFQDIQAFASALERAFDEPSKGTPVRLGQQLGSLRLSGQGSVLGPGIWLYPATGLSDGSVHFALIVVNEAVAVLRARRERDPDSWSALGAMLEHPVAGGRGVSWPLTSADPFQALHALISGKSSTSKAEKGSAQGEKKVQPEAGKDGQVAQSNAGTVGVAAAAVVGGVVLGAVGTVATLFNLANLNKAKKRREAKAAAARARAKAQGGREPPKA